MASGRGRTFTEDGVTTTGDRRGVLGVMAAFLSVKEEEEDDEDVEEEEEEEEVRTGVFSGVLCCGVAVLFSITLFLGVEKDWACGCFWNFACDWACNFGCGSVFVGATGRETLFEAENERVLRLSGFVIPSFIRSQENT
jgi:hypothetical protein